MAECSIVQPRRVVAYGGRSLPIGAGHNARYYDASIGRFISADTVVPDPADPQNLNSPAGWVNTKPKNWKDRT
jgi:hypothetical protein